MYKQLLTFLDANNILFKHQYGFRPKHSTVHPIIHLLNHCAEASNKIIPEYTLAIFCDISKAFDVISHDILFKKLNTYGIRGNVNHWFRSYLSDRKQFVLRYIFCMSTTYQSHAQATYYHLLMILLYICQIRT